MSRISIAGVLGFCLLSAACNRVGSGADYAAQVAEYERQAQETARQLERQGAILDKGEELLRRQAALVELQEQQAQRFNVVLDKWEKAEPR